jgi:uncharacterized protein (UPF0332 family)
LARGFISTAFIRPDSGEFEIRNALSRSYYALHHAFHAWLAMKNVPKSRRARREALFEQVLRKRGKEYGNRLDRFWSLRVKADYDEPEFFEASPFLGDLAKFRLAASDDLSLIEREFEFYNSEVDSFLSPGQKTGAV